MNRKELQAQSAADVQEIKDLMAAKNIRVEARQRLNTDNGFIELVAIFISEKVLNPEVEPSETEEVVPVETKESHADLA